MLKRFLEKGIIKNRAQEGLGFFFLLLTLSRPLVVLIAAMLFLSCDGQGDTSSREKLTPEDITIAQVSGVGNADNPIAFVAITKDGMEVAGVFAEKDASGDPTAITGAFYISELTDAIIIDINSEGLPSSVIDSLGNVILFENYTDSTVDISVFDAEDNLVEGPITVDVDPSDLIEIQELFSLSSAAITSSRINSQQALRQFEFTVRNSLKWAGKVTGATLCTLAVLKTGGLALKIIAPKCIPVFISIITEFTDDEFDDFISGFVGAGSCALTVAGGVGVAPDPESVIECIIAIVDQALLLFPEPPPEPTPMPTLMPPPPPPLPTPVTTPEVCHDGIDNDRDGLVDCADQFDCFFHPACQEVCDDGVDNNRDRLIDCEDPLCDNYPACQGFCPDSGVEFLSFIQGDPHIPGDGIFVDVSPSFEYLLAPPFSLSGVTDGITIFFFPHPSDRVIFEVPIILAIDATVGGLCFASRSIHITPSQITFNGVIGYVFNFTQANMEGLPLLVSLTPGCEGLTLDDFSIDDFFFGDVDENQFFPTLDAVAIGLGQVDCSNAR